MIVLPRPKHFNALHVYSFTDLVDMIARHTGLFKRDVRTVLLALKDMVTEQVSAGNAIRWRGFGIFLPVIRYTRKVEEGRQTLVPSTSRLGMVFYPAAEMQRLKPMVNVRDLLDMGGYHGPRSPRPT